VSAFAETNRTPFDLPIQNTELSRPSNTAKRHIHAEGANIAAFGHE